MKARVKATGEIVEVVMYSGYDDYDYVCHKNECVYDAEELEFDDEPDYWERLKHQYAGMAMQGLVANQSIIYGQDFSDALDEHITVNAVAIAHALVEKLKEEEKK